MARQNRVEIVVVLYKCTEKESPALQSLLRLKNKFDNRAEILVVNNDTQTFISKSSEYVLCQAEDNFGLSTAFNFALQRAIETGRQFLITVDQDTVINERYVDEVMSVLNKDEQNIVSYVPVLRSSDGTVLSPSIYNYFDGLYQSFKTIDHISESVHRSMFHRQAAVEDSLLSDEIIFSAFNSAAMYRVERLIEIGGFPSDYPLDFLDHALYRNIHFARMECSILNCELSHSLSSKDSSMSKSRAESWIRSTGQYYADEFLYIGLALPLTDGLDITDTEEWCDLDETPVMTNHSYTRAIDIMSKKRSGSVENIEASPFNIVRKLRRESYKEYKNELSNKGEKFFYKKYVSWLFNTLLKRIVKKIVFRDKSNPDISMLYSFFKSSFSYYRSLKSTDNVFSDIEKAVEHRSGNNEVNKVDRIRIVL